jgi:hypothetical protein
MVLKVFLATSLSLLCATAFAQSTCPEPGPFRATKSEAVTVSRENRHAGMLGSGCEIPSDSLNLFIQSIHYSHKSVDSGSQYLIPQSDLRGRPVRQGRSIEGWPNPRTATGNHQVVFRSRLYSGILLTTQRRFIEPQESFTKAPIDNFRFSAARSFHGPELTVLKVHSAEKSLGPRAFNARKVSLYLFSPCLPSG